MVCTLPSDFLLLNPSRHHANRHHAEPKPFSLILREAGCYPYRGEVRVEREVSTVIAWSIHVGRHAHGMERLP